MNNGRGGSTTGVWRVKHWAMMDGQGSAAANLTPPHCRRPSALTHRLSTSPEHPEHVCGLPSAAPSERPRRSSTSSNLTFRRDCCFTCLFVLLLGFVALASLQSLLIFFFFLKCCQADRDFSLARTIPTLSAPVPERHGCGCRFSAVALFITEEDQGHKGRKQTLRLFFPSFKSE